MMRPVLLLTRADRTLLGLEKYPPQIMLAKLVLPVCEQNETQVEENIFGFLAEHTSPKNVNLDVELFLPAFRTGGQEGNFDESLLS